MPLPLAIIAGIAAAFCWGVGDFIAKFAIDKIGSLRTLFWAQLVGLATLLPLLLFFPFTFPSGLPLVLIILAGALNALAFFAFYKGFEKGNLSIVSPIGGSAAAVTVILSLLFLGERLSQPQAAGVLLILVGIVLASVKLSELRRGKREISAGVPEAVVSMLCWGTMWFLIALAERDATWLSALVVMRAAGVGCALAFTLLQGGPLPRKKPLPWKVLLPTGLFDAVGFIAVAFAITSQLASLVVPISHGYPLVTVLLALLILKERPALNQLVGALAVIAGIAAISL